MYLLWARPSRISTLFPYTTLFRSTASNWHQSRRRCLRGFRGPAQIGCSGGKGCNRLLCRAIEFADTCGKLLGCFRSEEHTSELQSQSNTVCRLLLEKKDTAIKIVY